MTDVTQILSQIEHSDPAAAERLLPLVYDQLRRRASGNLAKEKPGQTLQATALVHEAYVRLVGPEPTQLWDSRGHFFVAAAGTNAAFSDGSIHMIPQATESKVMLALITSDGEELAGMNAVP